MSDLKRYLSKNETIKANAIKKYREILNDYTNGKIQSETEFIYTVKNKLLEFYNSIGKPTFTPYIAIGAPVSSKYNAMIESAINDIEEALSNCVQISTAIEGNFISSNLSEDSLNNASNLVLKTLEDLNESVETFVNDGTSFTDSFTGNECSTSETNAYINSQEGILTLPLDNTYSVVGNTVHADILSSNGLPGNTHVATKSVDSVVFDGEHNMRKDVSAMVDMNNDTWLEYEIYNINDDVYNECNGFGFSYKENVSWITDDNELFMKIRFTPQRGNIKYNWFSIIPYLPSSKAYIPAILDKVVIMSDDVENIKVNKALKDTMIITFNEKYIQYIDVYIKQTSSYKVNVGHIYTIKLPNANSSIYNRGVDSIYNRVDHYNPSLSLLGVSYDPKTSSVIHGSTTSSLTSISEHKSKKGLFSVSDETGYISDKEIIPADRYMIGIKEVYLSKYIYKKEGVYVSKAFTSEKEINSVTLNSTEIIPTEFSGGEYIKYYLTFDDGSSWHRIYPKDKAYLGPCTIKINSDDTLSVREKNLNKIKYIDRLLDTNSVKMKIVLSRPSDKNYNSPVVRNYRLEIKTGGDKFDN